MRNPDLQSSFEEYRRDRTFRRLQQSGPARPMGKNAQILQQLEQAEQSEVRDEQLTREVHDFFADATRTAAGIVQKIHGTAEEQVVLKMRAEIEDFLQDVIRRAGGFMTVLHQRPAGGPVEQNLEPRMQNLVGPQLDHFRHEGTAQLEDKHIGQDPFHTPIAAEESAAGDPGLVDVSAEDGAGSSDEPWFEPADETAPDEAVAASTARVEPVATREHGEAREATPAPVQPAGAEPVAADPASPRSRHGLEMLFDEQREKIREAVQLLVDSGILKPEEARVVFEQRMKAAHATR